MKFQEYNDYFQKIVESPKGERPEPYNDDEYFSYTSMNWTRSQRWMKTAKLNSDLVALIKNIKEPQTWLLITEPWCGDAAHSVPFFGLLAAENPLINFEIELRDSEPQSINNYLTNGGKSIPILVFRNQENKDFALWGPRPKSCSDLFFKLKEEGLDFDSLKEQIQKWYNADKGKTLQEELIKILS